ncbi:hypothetical protein H5392_03360 [Tessaracoccus sp. MC1865]|uniref:hypothetical protein n=1 Tax=Tessaracoccus sp. MC1865 TaxID=2760310 RepID=UPI0015FFE192|nr:hypothetical protein [Tessaracoccus sp. MC1865]MBB1482896.1 hypothetical protein [Tessaracoccus sp. MC1865]QTO37665.1 hypothetical protein J7D54_00725 [Tessaracoccus sp. MC1865]
MTKHHMRLDFTIDVVDPEGAKAIGRQHLADRVDAATMRGEDIGYQGEQTPGADLDALLAQSPNVVASMAVAELLRRGAETMPQVRLTNVSMTHLDT